jgi:hypothetical protein
MFDPDPQLDDGTAAARWAALLLPPDQGEQPQVA